MSNGTWGNIGRKSFDLLTVVWPLVFVVVVIVVLLHSLSGGGLLDASTWPAIRKFAEERVDEPEISVHLRIASYYSVVSFSVGLFLLLNSLIFFVKIKTMQPIIERRKIAYMLSGFGIFLRGIALIMMVIWLAKLVVVDPADLSPLSDEHIVLYTFAFCAVADLSLLLSLLLESGIRRLLQNRELFGALFYIDVPTIIGVGIITYFAPSLLSSSKNQDMIFKAIAGGAMIIHVVSSQLILSFLIAEEKLGHFLGSRRRIGDKTIASTSHSPMPTKTSVAHSG